MSDKFSKLREALARHFGNPNAYWTGRLQEVMTPHLVHILLNERDQLLAKRGRRGSGNTSRQMDSAPRGAVFVWCTPDLAHPRELALDLGRGDLLIKPPSWVTRRSWLGSNLPIVVDHAFQRANGKDAQAALLDMRIYFSHRRI